MTHSALAVAPRPVLLDNPGIPRTVGRLLAILALTCLLTHIPMMVSHYRVAPVATILMGAIAAACIPCSRKMWCDPHTHDCSVAAALAVGMVALHGVIGLSMAAGGMPMVGAVGASGHRHGAASLVVLDQLTAGHGYHLTMSLPLIVSLYLATGLAMLQVVSNALAVSATKRRLSAT